MPKNKYFDVTVYKEAYYYNVKAYDGEHAKRMCLDKCFPHYDYATAKRITYKQSKSITRKGLGYRDPEGEPYLPRRNYPDQEELTNEQFAFEAAQIVDENNGFMDKRDILNRLKAYKKAWEDSGYISIGNDFIKEENSNAKK